LRPSNFHLGGIPVISISSLAKSLGSAILAATIVDFAKSRKFRSKLSTGKIEDIADQIINSFDHDLDVNERQLVKKVLSKTENLVEFLNYTNDDDLIEREFEFSTAMSKIRSIDESAAVRIEGMLTNFSYKRRRCRFVDGIIDMSPEDAISTINAYTAEALETDDAESNGAYEKLVDKFGIQYTEAEDMAYGVHKFLERKWLNRALEKMGSAPWTAKVTDDV
jgi:hypothetical protein